MLPLWKNTLRNVNFFRKKIGCTTGHFMFAHKFRQKKKIFDGTCKKDQKNISWKVILAHRNLSFYTKHKKHLFPLKSALACGTRFSHYEKSYLRYSRNSKKSRCTYEHFMFDHKSFTEKRHFCGLCQTDKKWRCFG